MQRGIKINQLAPIGFGAVILLAVGTNFLYQWNTDNLLKSAGWVTHTYKIKQNLAELEKTLVDAETGQRGFIYTGKQEFLEPYSE